MLCGETGTGKELFAQAIHNCYCGNQGQYVDINCAAIPENLIEGLLFGTAKGAYTGAVDRAGFLNRPMAAPFSWMRSTPCPCLSRANCSG